MRNVGITDKYNTTRENHSDHCRHVLDPFATTDDLANQHQMTQVNNVDDSAVEFDRMSEEDLLRGLEGLVPPERSDDV